MPNVKIECYIIFHCFMQLYFRTEYPMQLYIVIQTVTKI